MGEKLQSVITNEGSALPVRLPRLLNIDLPPELQKIKIVWHAISLITSPYEKEASIFFGTRLNLRSFAPCKQSSIVVLKMHGN